MNFKKVLFLFLALLLPVLIFLFLKSFGKNEFEVPVLFADSVTAPVACKSPAYKAPYTIADSVLENITWNAHDIITIVVFTERNAVNQSEQQIHIGRALKEFEGEKFQIIRFREAADSASGLMPVPNVKDIRIDRTNLEHFRNCIFLLSPADNAVIIDQQKRIRGQYNLTKREDADRMIMQEMNILFKRY